MTQLLISLVLGRFLSMTFNDSLSVLDLIKQKNRLEPAFLFWKKLASFHLQN
jgi:hypothetical protein